MMLNHYVWWKCVESWRKALEHLLQMELLSGAESVDLRGVRKEIRKSDREKMLEKCAEKSQLIVEVGKEVG